MNRTYLRGDMYYADLGRGIGSEQEGYRPVLIIQNNTGNKYSSTVVVAAISSKVDAKPDTLEFAPFINIMSEWYAKDISKKVKTGIKTKGMSGKPIATEAPYGYVKSPDNKDFWIIDEEAAGVVRLIFRLFLDGKNRNQIAVYLTQAQIPTPTFYMNERGRGTCKNRALNVVNRYKWKAISQTKKPWKMKSRPESWPVSSKNFWTR